jgi:antitoxin component of MazEF toxin-antitoxin module
MESINVRVKRWGNSFGVVLPREIIDRENVKEGAEIEISIRAKHKTKARDIFGVLKGKLNRDTDDLLDEVDRDFEG